MSRQMFQIRLLAAAAGLLAAIGSTRFCAADVVVFDDKLAWEAAVGGDFTTITFTEFPPNTIITDQYAEQGFVVTPNAVTFGPTAGFPQDMYGLGTVLEYFILDFDRELNWIAVDHPGGLNIDLYLDEVLVGYSGYSGGGGVGFFTGVVSDLSFNRVRISDLDAFAIDDLHFGPMIPAPAAWVVLAAMSAMGARRRRS